MIIYSLELSIINHPHFTCYNSVATHPSKFVSCKNCKLLINVSPSIAVSLFNNLASVPQHNSTPLSPMVMKYIRTTLYIPTTQIIFNIFLKLAIMMKMKIRSLPRVVTSSRKIDSMEG